MSQRRKDHKRVLDELFILRNDFHCMKIDLENVKCELKQLKNQNERNGVYLFLL